MLAILIKEKCRKLNLSSREAADVVGVSHATILRALRGDVIDLETAIKFAKWLQVKTAALINSLPSSPDTLADQVAVVLERHPKLKDTFSKVMKALSSGEVDPALVDDIALYAAYKLGARSKMKP